MSREYRRRYVARAKKEDEKGFRRKQAEYKRRYDAKLREKDAEGYRRKRTEYQRRFRQAMRDKDPKAYRNMGGLERINTRERAAAHPERDSEASTSEERRERSSSDQPTVKKATEEGKTVVSEGDKTNVLHPTAREDSQQEPDERAAPARPQHQQRRPRQKTPARLVQEKLGLPIIVPSQRNANRQKTLAPRQQHQL